MSPIRLVSNLLTGGLLRRRGTGGRHGAEDGDGRCDARVTGSGAEDPAHGDPLLAGDPLDHREATVPRRRADRPALAASAQEIALDCDGIVGRDEDRQGDEGLGECWVRAAFVPPLQGGAEPRGRRGKHRIVHDQPTAVIVEQREIAHDEFVRHVLLLDRFGFHSLVVELGEGPLGGRDRALPVDLSPGGVVADSISTLLQVLPAPPL